MNNDEGDHLQLNNNPMLATPFHALLRPPMCKAQGTHAAKTLSAGGPDHRNLHTGGGGGSRHYTGTQMPVGSSPDWAVLCHRGVGVGGWFLLPKGLSAWRGSGRLAVHPWGSLRGWGGDKEMVPFSVSSETMRRFGWRPRHCGGWGLTDGGGRSADAACTATDRRR